MRCVGTFLSRPNRFVAHVRLDTGEMVSVHVASSGRMAEILLPGVPVIVDLHGKADRKTGGRLVMARPGEAWVSVDTSLPGRLFSAAFANRSLPTFGEYTDLRPEVRYGDSRIDFLLTGPDLPPCFVEVKSVTSALPDPDGVLVARFPDAPTQRGAKHLHELMRAAQEGYRAAVCFIVQRDDAAAFGPYDAIDPGFGDLLRTAARSGVEIHAWSSHVSPAATTLGSPMPIRLDKTTIQPPCWETNQSKW